MGHSTFALLSQLRQQMREAIRAVVAEGFSPREARNMLRTAAKLACDDVEAAASLRSGEDP